MLQSKWAMYGADVNSFTTEACVANELWEGSLPPIIGVGDASHKVRWPCSGQ